MLSRKPFIAVVYDSDFLRRLDAFANALGNISGPRHIIMQLGWQHETGKALDELAQGLPRAREKGFEVFVLANTQREKEVIAALGADVELCHQNAFLDERRYPLLPFVKKCFDAIYVARITPFKRHDLAGKIMNICLIGSHHNYENDYYEKVYSMFPDGTIKYAVSSLTMAYHMQKAHCGLCLSREEGAMFVSAEYMLSGIPAVNTANIGGRDLLMPDFAVKSVSDDPDDVKNAVMEWCADAPEPREIRESTIALMRPHREKLVEILASFGMSDELCRKYLRRFPHKLGIRTSLDPLTSFIHKVHV